MNHAKRNYIAIILIFFFCFFFLFFWKLPLYPPDEPKYTFSAVKMLETGDYITPNFNCKERLEKPILTYWLIAGSYKILGVSDWVSKIPFILISFVLLLTIYIFSLKELGYSTAITASLIFCTNLHIFAYSKAIIPENPLLFFNTLSIFLFYYGLRDEKKLLIILGYLSCGLGFLTKGPLALIIPVGINFPYFFIKKGFLNTLKNLLNPLGIIIFLSVSLVWYGPVIYIHGYKFIDEFFILHNVKRFTGSASMHIYPFYYYIPIIFATYYLWLPAFPNFFKYIVSPNKTRFEGFVVWWCIFVLILFSLSKNKLHHYIIIIYPALSILIASSFSNLKERKAFSDYVLILMLIVEIAFTLMGSKFYENIMFPVKTALIISAIFTALLIISNRLFKKWVTITINGLKFFIITLILLLNVGGLRSEILEKIKLSKNFISPAEKLYTYKRGAEDINFYLNICTEMIEDNNELDRILNEKGRVLAVLRGRNIKELEGYNLRIIIDIPSFKTKDQYLAEIKR